MLTQQQRAELAARLRRGRDTHGPRSIARHDPSLAVAPASAGQEQLWFLDRFAPGQAVYNIPCVLRIRGPLDIAALGRALTALTARHEPLRTRLVPGDQGRPVQVIDPPVPVKPRNLELNEAELRPFIHAEAMCPFDLAAGPLLRATLIRIGDGDHVLAAVIHHAVFDGWSAGLFLRDLAALYRAEVTGEPSGLTDLPVQFGDFAVWERDRIASGALADLEHYWRRTLAGFGTVQFPADHPRPAMDDFTGARAERATDLALLDGLRELSRREGTTLYTTLLAALFALLYRYTGQDDLIAGTVSANRSRPELAPLIGFLVNTLPIRVDASGNPSFSELLARVKDATIGAFAHQDLPFGRLVDALEVRRDASRAPVFQIAFSYAERDDAAVPAAGAEFAVSDMVVGIDAAKFDLTFVTEGRRGGLWTECSYKTALFDPATVTDLLLHWEILLRGVIGSPSARLSELPLLSPAGLHFELRRWNDTAGPAPAGCAHEIFEAQVARTPAATAAVCDGQRVSYADLNREANRVAWHLRGLGAGPEDLVGVRMTPSRRRLAAILGIWKAGAGYVPLDPALPVERLAFMVRDADVSVVLTDSFEAPHGRDDNPGDSGATPANVAYVIYTSGSTGQPKGVVVEHRNLVNFTHAVASQWQVGPGSRVLASASFAFDASVIDMVAPLLHGATVVVGLPDTVHSPPRLAALLRDARITCVFLPPALLGLLPDGDYPDLRLLVTGAEQVPTELARRWTRPGLRLVNVYGPTECTVVATWAELDACTPMPPPIGYPIRPNVRVYVLDRHGNPVPPGVPGELHIGGAGVARGYLNRPELTRERFADSAYGRLYRTGDLVRRRRDGSLVFLGRLDGQVKFRGLRVELGEIEAALAVCPGVAQAVVTVTAGPGGDAELAAYLRPAGGPLDTGAIRAQLVRSLPDALIPAHLITVTAFPLNSSGKVDRAKLPAPGPHVAAAREAPATATETLLAGMYETLLGCGRVGATDSFFDLGGNSLSAMRLVDEISRRTGADIGVTAVFLHPAPRQLAAVLDGARHPAGPLVSLTPESAAEVPLFLIHAVGGTVASYAPLSRELAGTFTVYGLESPALGRAARLPAALDGLVADYTRRIRAARPHGPYLLGGWSMGAVLAFEIARDLERAGERVSLLVLLDPPFAIPRDFDADAGTRFAQDAARSTGVDVTDLDLDSEPMRRRLRVFSAHIRLLAGYEPAGPPVRAPALIVSADSSPNAPTRDLWPDMLSGPVTVHTVPGDHYEFLRPPLAADVAAAIRGWAI
jgi:amino acid adenylation domain-containing protein